MELTKVCVELVWRLCFGVEFLWILNFGFYSYFCGDFGIDCRMVLCCVFGMFGVVFVTCFVASIGKILWLMDKGCFGMVSGQKLACTGAAKELSGTPVRGSHTIEWLGSKISALGYSIAWVSMQLRSPCTLSSIKLRTTITSSSELRFRCSWTLWKAL